jgi:hypothetical protein
MLHTALSVAKVSISMPLMEVFVKHSKLVCVRSTMRQFCIQPIAWSDNDLLWWDGAFVERTGLFNFLVKFLRQRVKSHES